MGGHLQPKQAHLWTDPAGILRERERHTDKAHVSFSPVFVMYREEEKLHGIIFTFKKTLSLALSLFFCSNGRLLEKSYLSEMSSANPVQGPRSEP